MGTFNKQLCVGVAAAGIFGLGSAVASGVAYADTASADSAPSVSADKGGSASAGPRAHARAKGKSAKAAAAPASAAASDEDVASPASLREAARVPAAPAPAPIPVPLSPIPLAPVSPASAVSGSTSAATGRSRFASVVAPAAAVDELADAPEAGPVQHVLVIGIDGTNLSSILSDGANQNLFNLMSTGTTAASSIMGHTTISNPSWTSILTGVWSETAGVSNNVFTPWTYDAWPTIFNQLETFNPAIETTVIANWANIAQIAGAGTAPADNIFYYAPVNNDFIGSDNTVSAASINAILNTEAGTPSFQFTYFVGVDDTGHEFDAGSPQYANALRNVDQNIGAIMAEIDTWESENPGEEWTVIVTTDHGQVPWPTIKLGSQERAHGFQTPWETTTFVIANGPGFAEGAINNTYLNVDITPTVSQLFGLAPEPYSVGKPLAERSANDYRPIIPGIDAIKQALTDVIDTHGYPDIVTNIDLVFRTVVATIPYAVWTIFDGLATSVPDFLVMPIEFIGAIIYQAINIPAQLILRLTGVTGNQIIPPDLWPFYPIPGTQPTAPSPAAVWPVLTAAHTAA